MSDYEAVRAAAVEAGALAMWTQRHRDDRPMALRLWEYTSDEVRSKYRRRAAAAIAAYEAHMAAAGWVRVPVKPTREMWAASGNALVNGRVKLNAHHDYLSETVYRAMLAARPGAEVPDA